jgi:DNA polymerase III subunit delta'
MEPFAALPEQPEAKRLLTAALREGPTHAYLLHGPAGTGKTAAAYAFAGAVLGDPRRAAGRAHPDLYVLEALGEMIRIDAVRELRHDLHMRPFEADRRVYLILSAHLLNEDAADALLKDLEEPPPYAVIVLVADELGPLPPTIRSRCQLVPFRRLSEKAVREWVEEHAPGLSPNEATALARVAAGRLDRARRLLEPASAEARERLLEVARGPYADADFDPGAAADTVLTSAREQGARAKETAEAALEGRDLPGREAEQQVKRAARGAERDELLASLEELALWYRDLVVADAGAEAAVVHADRLAQLREDATRERAQGAERAAELVRETWRSMEEFNVNPSLTLEALFIRLRRELGAAAPV